MSENSYWWTTSSSGDGAAKYSRADLSNVAKILAACNRAEGVAPSDLNALSGTVTGANAISINTGYALVDGKPYYNNAAAAMTIPSASGAGNTRIDRIVLRADWTAQTVRLFRIAGVDAASPTAPAITQTSGTLYDVKLYQALVNTSGTVTLTDERTLAQVQTSGIAPGSITSALLASGAVLAANLDSTVRFQKLGQINGNGTGVVSIASIPNTFSHLLLIVAGRCTDTASGVDNLYLRFNDDAGANYNGGGIQTLGSSVINQTPGSVQAGAQAGGVGTSTSSSPSINLILIPNYVSTSLNKQVMGIQTMVAPYWLALNGGYWTSTAAINKISLYAYSGGTAYYLTTDSVVSLYGIP